MSEERSEIVEDTVICLDVSRSMARRDLAPDRFTACKQACITFTRKKLAYNPQNNVGIVLFGEKADKTLFLTNDGVAIEACITDAAIAGRVSYIGAAIALAVQMHVDMLRQISGKVSRVLVVSDGRFTHGTPMDPLDMARLAMGLGIQVDAINIGIEDSVQVLRNIAAITGGQYASIDGIDDLSSTIDSLARPLPEETRDYLKSKKPLMSDLAGDLVSITGMSAVQREMLEKMSQAEREKCIICFTPVTGDGGRFCPNCASPVHLQCAAQWALADKKTDSNIFRCTHCYYLLKVPTEVREARERDEQARVKEEYLKQEEKRKQQEKTRNATTYATRVTPQELGPEVLVDMTCPVCNEPFEDDDHLYECINLDCSALYHPRCMEKLVDASGTVPCKQCKQVLKRYD